MIESRHPMEFIFGAYDAKRKLVRMNKKTMENTPVRPSARPSVRAPMH